MSPHWDRILQLARDEVSRTIRELPSDLRNHAGQLAVTFESWPSEDLLEDGWENDLLGMFIGDSLRSADLSGTARQIILFLENIWDYAEADPEVFREEIHITFIHEFGHYLGLDEVELEERGLL